MITTATMFHRLLLRLPDGSNRWCVVRAASENRATDLALARFPGARLLCVADPGLDSQGMAQAVAAK
jgi:hypothetical protein